MKSTSDYTIRSLSNDDGYWRVDWFGQVNFPPEIDSPSQPHIEIQFSKLSGEENYLAPVFDIENGIWPSTQTIRLPVGMLPMFKIGDIWHRQKHFSSPGYETIEFTDLLVNNDTTSVIKSGLAMDGKDGDAQFFLPIRYHPFHTKHTQSYCLRVEHEDVNIVIPAAELIRFYFGSSSKLVSRLFDGPFAPENFWQHVEFDESPAKPTIHLATGMPGLSAADIARLALSDRAQSAGKLISGSCIAAKANGSQVYPKMIFPFSGRTDLVVSGQWMPFDGIEKGVFLAFKLISCSHPFPFRELRYTSERKYSTSSRAGAQRNESANTAEKRYVRAQNDTGEMAGEESTKRKVPRFLSLGGTKKRDAFPDLAEKQIAKIDSEQVPTIMHTLAGRTYVRASSVGDSGMDAAIAPIDVVATDTAAEGKYRSSGTSPPHVAVFLSLVARFLKLANILSVDIVRLNSRQRCDYLSTMPQIVDDDGVIHPSCLTRVGVDPDAGSRHRKISISRICGADTTYFLLIPEPQEVTASFIEGYFVVNQSMTISTAIDLQAILAELFSGPQKLGQIKQFSNDVTSVYWRTHSPTELRTIELVTDNVLVHFEHLRQAHKLS